MVWYNLCMYLVSWTNRKKKKNEKGRVIVLTHVIMGSLDSNSSHVIWDLVPS